jgi:hypothetical protein
VRSKDANRSLRAGSGKLLELTSCLSSAAYRPSLLRPVLSTTVVFRRTTKLRLKRFEGCNRPKDSAAVNSVRDSVCRRFHRDLHTPHQPLARPVTLLAIHTISVSDATAATGSHSKPWAMVVFLHRDVRCLPLLLFGRLLATHAFL